MSHQDSPSHEQRLLSHLAAHLFHEVGGNLPVETLHLRATDYLDISAEHVHSIVEEASQDDIYRIERDHDSAQLGYAHSEDHLDDNVVVALDGQ